MTTESTSELVALLSVAGLDPAPWSNGPRAEYAAHSHAYDKVLVVSHGSIVFGLPDTGEALEMAYGDRLDLPAGTRHDAKVGAEGVECLEAHAPAGTLDGSARLRSAGSW
jgi:uncharacterized protein YjlB